MSEYIRPIKHRTVESTGPLQPFAEPKVTGSCFDEKNNHVGNDSPSDRERFQRDAEWLQARNEGRASDLGGAAVRNYVLGEGR